MFRKSIVIGLFGLSLAILAFCSVNAGDDAKPTKDHALDRARREVKMLDTIYKNAIVLVTKHYVNDEDDLPAGTAFKRVFKAANDGGFNHTRLLDATGEPYDDSNVAKTDFEKRAIKKLVSGESYFEQVVNEKGKRYLLAATAIPVVMKKCITCHENYEDVPDGKAIGALTYKIPVFEK